MPRPKIKICGLTKLSDALAAVACGADFLGFIFASKSPRRTSPERVREMVGRLPREVRKVGVFVDTPASEVVATLAYCGLDIAQLHGDETAEQAIRIGVERVWKAFHLTSDDDVSAALAFPAAAVLTDTMLPGQRGGTGRVGDWRRAAEVARQRKLVLAGGIQPANVVEAMRVVEPYALDVGSGVESEPGRKDAVALRALFAAANGEPDACRKNTC